MLDWCAIFTDSKERAGQGFLNVELSKESMEIIKNPFGRLFYLENHKINMVVTVIGQEQISNIFSY